MNCPLCVDQALQPHVRSGVEIDVCPHCKGVWLDRGELDKLVDARPAERSRPAAPPPSADRGDVWTGSKKKKKKKQKSFGERLGDLLEEVLD